MTTPSTPRKAGPFNGTGSQTAWPFTFKVFAAGDVRVAIANAQGVETTLVAGTDYSVTLNANQETSPGGTVTYPISGSALPVGSVLAIAGDVDYDQPLDIPNGGNFNPVALENQLDRATMQIQQVKEAVDRSAKMPITASTEDIELFTVGIIALADSVDEITAVATDIANVNTVAADLNEPVSEINTVAGAIANVNVVGNNISSVNTVAGISANVTTVAGVAANVTTVAGVAGNVTTVAGISGNVTTVAGISADVQTVADNLADVTNFADVYYGPKASDPTLRNDGTARQAGDLYFNTGSKRTRVFDGAAWVEGTTDTPGTYSVQNFSGNGSTTAFTLSANPVSKNNTQVYIGGVYQQKDQYSVSGTTLTFGSAPPSGTNNVEVVVISPLSVVSTEPDAPVYVIAITGQSNAAGANSGGPNPASSLVKVWNGATSAWGSSDYTQAPFSLSTPNGNAGNNNIGLAFAHRLADEEGARVYVIYDAVGGRPIEDWTGSGTASVRYAALKTKVQAALADPELVAAGKTKLDFLIWAQGEENAVTDTLTVYRTKFATLDAQFRAETWMASTTPMLVMGMSGLHTRYQVWQAQLDYCENVNRNCIYVNSMGLKTEFDMTGAGDYTHWLGTSLWEHGYHRAWYALRERGVTHRQSVTPFYARGAGPWRGESDAIAMFSSLVSRDSVTDEFPLNGPAATGSISWGYQCSADGNYSMAGGYNVVIDNLGNYSLGWGRDISFAATGDYSAAFGYQHTVNATYGFAAGRGHTVTDDGSAAFGLFSFYTTTQANPVIHQVGVGTTTSNRKNAITVRADGNVELNTAHTSDPSQNKEICFEYVTNTSLKIKMRGADGVVRSATLTLA